MTHTHHLLPVPDDTGRAPIFYDGCGECESRCTEPLAALCTQTPDRCEALWRRMLVEKVGLEPHEFSSTMFGSTQTFEIVGYESELERRVGEQLYLLAVCEQRHPMNGYEAFQPGRFWG